MRHGKPSHCRPACCWKPTICGCAPFGEWVLEPLYSLDWQTLIEEMGCLCLMTLSFGFGSKLPLLLQTEANRMWSRLPWHGGRFPWLSNRSGQPARAVPVSLKGGNAGAVDAYCPANGAGHRALKLSWRIWASWWLPCVLHWNFNHFVVLKQVSGKGVTIHDPAMGVRTLSLDEVSRCFTGVALELWPNPGFQPQQQKQPVRLTALLGKVSGLYRSFAQVLLLALSLKCLRCSARFSAMGDR